MRRSAILLVACLGASTACLLEDNSDGDVDEALDPVAVVPVCTIDGDGEEVCEGDCESGTCRVDSPPTDFEPEPDEEPEEDENQEPADDDVEAVPLSTSVRTGKALRDHCAKNPGRFPEYPGEVCTDHGGWGTWLMCHSKNAVDRNYRPRCRQCRDNWIYVENRCKSIPKSKPIEKIQCLKDAMRGWIGNGGVCDEASRCLMRILRRVGYQCHREASDTHAWVVCNIDGTRHVFDGNNGMYYTCKPASR